MLELWLYCGFILDLYLSSMIFYLFIARCEAFGKPGICEKCVSPGEWGIAGIHIVCISTAHGQIQSAASASTRATSSKHSGWGLPEL